MLSSDDVGLQERQRLESGPLFDDGETGAAMEEGRGIQSLLRLQAKGRA